MTQTQPNAPRPMPLRAKIRALPGPAWIIFTGTFVNKFGNFFTVFLVLYLVHSGYSSREAGIALGVAGLGAIIGNIWGGTITDRFGRRIAITISMFGSSATTFAFPFVKNITAIIVLACVVGVFQQLYRPAAGALLNDVVTDETRVTAFAIYRLAINLGMAVGPFVGGVLSEHSYTLVFWGDALTSMIYGLLGLLFLPKQAARARAQEATGAPTGKPTRENYGTVLSDRSYLLFLLAIVVVTLVYLQSTSTLPLQVIAAGFSNTFYGLLLGMNALIIVLVEVPLVNLIERGSPTLAMAAGILCTAVGFGVMAYFVSRPALLISVAIWTVGEMLYTPLATVVPGMYAPPGLRGRYQGAFGVANTIPAALAPVIGTAAYAFDPHVLWNGCLAAGALAVALLVLSERIHARRTHQMTTPAAQETAQAT